MKLAKQRPITFVLIFYAVCFVFRAVEYMVIRTDQGIIGEAFIHKVIGILLLAASLRLLSLKWGDIGVTAKRLLRGICLGLVLGIGVFAVAYGVEFVVQLASGNAPSLRFFVTSYAVEGNRVTEGGFIFILICIVGNIINVIMEEGVFRGLFVRIMSHKHGFWATCMISSALFGLWHIASPIRNVIDGVQSPMGAFMAALLLVVTSALLGIQYVMLYRVTGTLWAGMAAHFINNASVNLLHVLTATGMDEMQAVRIAIAQTLSFVAVVVYYIIKMRGQAHAERTEHV